ncbi:MAG: hypothetical protein NZ929_00115 [Aigarchaeota archaeon]|nr:hypothetical protein [Aigarchaeota archaeon]MCX8193117.1 hypothetical protein [Nitrososphaeria archaeon]MDW7986740.1 hypothetical protein [Nitrososphaerota archaeon]
MDESLELKMLRLKKMRKIISSKSSEAGQVNEGSDFEDALRIFRERLGDRGEEVLDAALREYPELTKKVVMILAQKIREGVLKEKIHGGELLRLFENLGMHIHLETSIRYYKKGEYKSLSDLLRD